jgi:hypothetical protein
MTEIKVHDDPEDSRYVIEADGQPIGRLDYRLTDGQIAFTHAEIDPAQGGQGYGSQLAEHALDDARRRELEVLPLCPFVSDYIRQHREYAKLVPDEFRGRFGL